MADLLSLVSPIYSIVFLCVFVILLVRYLQFRKASAAGQLDQSTTQKALRNTVIAAVLTVLSAIPIFYAPSQKPPERTKATDDGMSKRTNAMPDEKPREQIEKEAEAKKPDVLKRQDEGFEKDKKEADDFIKKAIEEAQANE